VKLSRMKPIGIEIGRKGARKEGTGDLSRQGSSMMTPAHRSAHNGSFAGSKMTLLPNKPPQTKVESARCQLKTTDNCIKEETSKQEGGRPI
jgi:hypothetical protein